MTLFTLFFLLLFTALLHACFQFVISVMTILSVGGHAKRLSNTRIASLLMSYIVGVGVVTYMLISLFYLLTYKLFDGAIPDMLWEILSLMLITAGIGILLFYFRREQGTMLWIPRSYAQHINTYGRVCKNPFNTFLLGAFAALSELIFTFPLLITAGAITVALQSSQTPFLFLTYASITVVPLVVMLVYLGGGGNPGRVQKKRMKNKQALQVTLGVGFIMLAIALYSLSINPYSGVALTSPGVLYV